MNINFIGCADAGGASTAIDALRSSAHPISSLYFVANNQGNNMTHKQIFRQPSIAHDKYHRAALGLKKSLHVQRGKKHTKN